MNPEVALIIGAVSALICSIVLFVLVMPKSRDGQLPRFWQVVHNYFHFKQLFVEAALKFLFAFFTFFCIVCGFFLLFCSTEVRYGFYYTDRSLALYGLGLMLLGPLVLRLVYEVTMMFVLLVQNVIDINKKLKGNVSAGSAAPVVSAAPVAPSAPVKPVCPVCGIPYDPNVSDFCHNCGTKLH